MEGPNILREVHFFNDGDLVFFEFSHPFFVEGRFSLAKGRVGCGASKSTRSSGQVVVVCYFVFSKMSSYLGGGFKHFLFSALVGGKDSHVDLYVSSGFKPPTSYQFTRWFVKSVTLRLVCQICYIKINMLICIVLWRFLKI